nr:hypothetical protein [Tanacetum cinerariifolium]
MNPIVAQQTALDNALVAPDNRVKIRKCNMRISPSKKPQKKPTYLVVLDGLALSPCHPAFLISADIYPRLPNQEFDEPLLEKEIFSFVKKLGYKGDIGSVTEVFTDHMHQPWRTFAAIINKCLSGKTIGLDKIGLSRAHIRDDSVLGTLKFVAKSEENQVYGALISAVMINQKIQNSNSYKTYLAFATGATTPKKAKKWKKHAFLSKKQTLVITKEPAKQPVAIRQPTGVQIKDTHGVSVSKKKTLARAERNKCIDLLSEVALLEEVKMKKAIKISKRETHLHQAGGLGDGSSLEPEVPDEPKGKSIDIDEGTGLKPWVPDRKINEEMYDDVNVELKDAELTDEGKGDEEMTNAEKLNVEHEETKIISMLDVQVQHENPSIHSSLLLTVPVLVILELKVLSSIPKTVIAALATTIPPPIPPFIPYSQQSTPIPTPTTTEATTSTPIVQESETLSAIHLIVSDLEKEVKELKNVGHSSAFLATIKYEVLAAVKDYLGTSLDDALHKVLQRHTAEFIKERSIPADVVEPDDADKDEDPPARPDHGLKRRKTSKDVKPSKKAKSTDTSKGTTKSQPKPTGKFAQAEETMFEAGDTKLLHNLGEDMGKTDEPPIVKADPKDWLKKPKRPPTPDPEWNIGKQLMMDLLKIGLAAKYDLQGIKDIVPTIWNPIKVTYEKHDALVTSVKVNKWCGYGHLEEIEIRRADQKLYKFMEGDFPKLHLNDIKDMLLLVVQNKLFNLNSDVIIDLAVTLLAGKKVAEELGKVCWWKRIRGRP